MRADKGWLNPLGEARRKTLYYWHSSLLQPSFTSIPFHWISIDFDGPFIIFWLYKWQTTSLTQQSTSKVSKWSSFVRMFHSLTGVGTCKLPMKTIFIVRSAHQWTIANTKSNKHDFDDLRFRLNSFWKRKVVKWCQRNKKKTKYNRKHAYTHTHTYQTILCYRSNGKFNWFSLCNEMMVRCIWKSRTTKRAINCHRGYCQVPLVVVWLR